MQPQQHDDPFNDSKQQLLQGLATMSTVLEAGARWAAVGIQNKAAQREKEAQQEKAAEVAQREAEKLQAKVHDERRTMAATIGDDSLSTATFPEAAQVWRTATVHAASGDPVAQKVAGLAADRLRDLRPDLTDAYDRHRAAGLPVHEAMRAAAREVWESDARANRWAPPPVRPHGEREPAQVGKDGPAALPTGGQALDDLDAAVCHEAGWLMEYVSPDALAKLQRELRQAGTLPAGEAADLLRQYAGVQVAEGLLTPAAAKVMTDRVEAMAGQERGIAPRAASSPRPAVDDDLVSRMTFREAAQVWRTATVRAAEGDPVAQKIAGLAVERLRDLRPDLMDAYDRHRAEGQLVHSAMRAAAQQVWETDARADRWAPPPPPPPQGRPQGDRAGTLPVGGWKPLNDIDAAVRWEAGRLMEHVSVEALDELQRRFREAGNLPAGEAVDLLKQYVSGQVDSGKMTPADAEAFADRLEVMAAQERGRGVVAAGAVDDPRTPVDEHTAGQVASVVRDDTADHDVATAAAVRGGQGAARPAWANAFPAWKTPGKVPAAVAAKQPAQATTQAAATTRGRTR